MKDIAIAIFFSLVSGVACVGCFWLLKNLIVHGSPDFVSGLVGGVLWTLLARAVLKWFWKACNEAQECAKEYKTAKLKE